MEYALDISFWITYTYRTDKSAVLDYSKKVILQCISD